MPSLSAREIASALGGKLNGKGWRCLCPAHDDHDPSLDVRDGEQGAVFICRAGCTQDQVVAVLRERGLWTAPVEPRRRPAANPNYLAPFGKPDHQYPYLRADGLLAGTVCRWNATVDRRKEIRPCTWIAAESRWEWRAFDAPRPLYGLQELLARPAAQVLLVEGEKCRDAAAKALTGLVVVSWAGGSKAIEQTDWQPLQGKRLIAWPDNDDAGLKAMERILIAAKPASARMVIPGQDMPKAWDIADAIAEGWTAERLIAYAKDRAQDLTTSNVVALPGVALPKPSPVGWEGQLICDENGRPKPKSLHNWKLTLGNHTATKDLFAWNDVFQGPFLMRPPPWDERPIWTPRPLQDADEFNTAAWLELRNLTPKKADARDTIKSVAQEHRYNPVLDYLDGLKWDGIPRLAGGRDSNGHHVDPLSIEYLDAPDDAIYAAFVTKWHISAVARAFSPGCKADCMLIFESPQGRMKSTYLQVMATIGGYAYFADNIGDITARESIMQLHGTWIVEAAELSAFDRREINHIKAWLSRSTDKFNPKFENGMREVPRHFVVAGTHNPSGHGYLRDPTGARRFWPMPVGNIDIDAVERDRDQIWAEAVARYRDGAQWWLTPDEELAALVLTEDRQEEEPWGELIDRQIEDVNTVTASDVLSRIGVPVSQRSGLSVKRVAEYLARKGWNRDRGVWTRPR